MFEKNLEIGFLLDFYGEVLTERRRTVMNMYYNEDLSLAEIAGEIGISRQGVRELIKKSGEELSLLESKLGIAAKFLRMRDCAERINALTENGKALPPPLADELRALTEEIGS